MGEEVVAAKREAGRARAPYLAAAVRIDLKEGAALGREDLRQ